MLQTRGMLFQEAVMRFCGVTEIPTFEHPHPAVARRPVGSLGHACRGEQIEPCRTWLATHAKQPVSDEALTLNLCRVCRKGSRPHG